MIPTIDMRETGINIRRIMDERNLNVRDVGTLESYNIGCKRLYTYYVKLNKRLVA